jgi:hypothetical protein
VKGFFEIGEREPYASRPRVRTSLIAIELARAPEQSTDLFLGELVPRHDGRAAGRAVQDFLEHLLDARGATGAREQLAEIAHQPLRPGAAALPVRRTAMVVARDSSSSRLAGQAGARWNLDLRTRGSTSSGTRRRCTSGSPRVAQEELVRQRSCSACWSMISKPSGTARTM